mmetsp:Transcript_300/g.569  ORF Transcript_300/g.569 Transcript_300/m.569 type:complete len:240 (-) Transcript_300:530-1249(-)
MSRVAYMPMRCSPFTNITFGCRLGRDEWLAKRILLPFLAASMQKSALRLNRYERLILSYRRPRLSASSCDTTSPTYSCTNPFFGTASRTNRPHPAPGTPDRASSKRWRLPVNVMDRLSLRQFCPNEAAAAAATPEESADDDDDASPGGGCLPGTVQAPQSRQRSGSHSLPATKQAHILVLQWPILQWHPPKKLGQDVAAMGWWTGKGGCFSTTTTDDDDDDDEFCSDAAVAAAAAAPAA